MPEYPYIGEYDNGIAYVYALIIGPDKGIRLRQSKHRDNSGITRHMKGPIVELNELAFDFCSRSHTKWRNE